MKFSSERIVTKYPVTTYDYFVECHTYPRKIILNHCILSMITQHFQTLKCNI